MDARSRQYLEINAASHGLAEGSMVLERNGKVNTLNWTAIHPALAFKQNPVSCSFGPAIQGACPESIYNTSHARSGSQQYCTKLRVIDSVSKQR